MPLYKRKTYSGVVLEQELFNIAPNTRKLRDAEPRLPPYAVDAVREEFNLKQSLRRFIRLINHNFGPWSWYVTLTLDAQHYVDDFGEAAKLLDNYIRRLQYSCPDLVAVAVMGRGIKTDRIHFHMIISGTDREIISKKWKNGKIRRIEHLRENNFYNGKNHGKDYTGLATYMFNHWTPEQGGKRWRPTRSLRQPDKDKPTPVKRKYSETKPPQTPKGYMLVEAKSTRWGYQYFKYVRIPKEIAPPMKC